MTIMDASYIQSLTVKIMNANREVLDDANAIDEFMRQICSIAGLHIVNQIEHRFSPIGLSVAFLLEESHCAIHTWPDQGVAYINLTTCKGIDSSVTLKIKEMSEGVFAGNVILGEVSV